MCEVLVYAIAKVYRLTSGSSANIPVKVYSGSPGSACCCTSGNTVVGLPMYTGAIQSVHFCISESMQCDFLVAHMQLRRYVNVALELQV